MFFSILLGLFLFGIITFLLVSSWRIAKRRSELTAQVKTLQQDIQALEEKNQKLKTQISQAETETYWEKRIREQGYKKPGEEVAVILPPETSAEEKETPPGLWQKLLDKLKFW